MLDILKSSDWIAGWVGLLLVLLPVCISLYSQNTIRKKLKQDIQIYLDWHGHGDPAAVEFCRSSINLRMEKLYSSKTISSSDIILFVFYVIVWVCSIISIIFSVDTRAGWVVCFIIYSVLLIIETRKLCKKLHKQEENRTIAARVIRLHTEALDVLAELDSILATESMSNNGSFTKAKENRRKILDHITELEKIAKDIEGVDDNQLQSKRYRHP